MIKIKDDWSLTVDADGKTAWILDADGEPLFKGLISDDEQRIYASTAQYLLREFPGYEIVEHGYKGAIDGNVLWGICYRDTATGEALTVYAIDHYHRHTDQNGVITFYSVSDRIGWYDAQTMANLPLLP
jgi:hypothetical protein